MKKKILLLEDEISNQRLLNFILSKEYRLDVVENGLDAFNWLEANATPDLIIMDWIMPVMDGKTFLNHFRSCESYKQIPIIVLSSYDRIHEELVAMGFQAHTELAKPVNASVLKNAVADALCQPNGDYLH